MLATLAAAWLVASTRNRRRMVGFWVFIVSNVLWVVWGLHDGAMALIALQLGLAALNIRGVWKNEPETAPNDSPAARRAPDSRNPPEASRAD